MDHIEVGDRLPELRLSRAGAGTTLSLRGPHRDAVVVVALHDLTCAPCRSYLAALAGARERFRVWDGSVRAVAPAGADAADAAALQDGLPSGVDVVTDPDRAFLGRIGVGNGPVVLVADRYGQVFHRQDAGAEHAVVEPRELEEWLRYLATQCPECGVLDQPGRAGLSL